MIPPKTLMIASFLLSFLLSYALFMVVDSVLAEQVLSVMEGDIVLNTEL